MWKITVHHVKISNRFIALGNSVDIVDNSSACGSVREVICISSKVNLGCYELKQHKPCFDKVCLKLLHERKQGKLQWLQNLFQMNRYDLNNVRLGGITHYRNNKRAYLKNETK
jgi:hypothetical protein